MKTAFELAAESYLAEVEREAIKLIERGLAPYVALSRAHDIVRQNRQKRATRG
jgi:hypothetical protein